MPDRCEFLTVREVMALLRLGRTTVYAQARLYLATGGAEGIPCRRFGRSLRFPAGELASFADDSWRHQRGPARVSVGDEVSSPETAESRGRPSRKPAAQARRSSHTSQSRRTASAPVDETVVQVALPFTD